MHGLVQRLPPGQNRLSVKPGLIIGAANTGVPNLNDALWRVIATAAVMKIFPDGPPGSWLYMAHVDTIATKVAQQLFAAESIPLLWINGMKWSLLGSEEL